jgi:predicted permease
VFSVLDSILLRPLPYPEPDQLAVLWERNVPRARDRNVVSVPTFESWREQSASYAATAGLVPDRSTLTDRNPERVYGAAVSPEWFDVVGVRARLGRGFTTADALQEPQAIVLSDGFWRDRFGGDESIVDRTIMFGDDAYRVTGVMPPDFEPPAFGWLEEGQRYWVPFLPDADNRQIGRFLLVLGRLRPGVTVAAADAELERMAAGPGEFDERDEWSADVVGLRTEVTGAMRAQGVAVAVAVGLLLLIAIANVAGVVLVRARGRADELRMRVALGASRRSLARQLLAESAAIALLSVPIAAMLATAGVYGASRLLPPELPRLDEVAVSWPAAAVCGLVLVLATVVVGLAPLIMRPDTARAASSAQRIVRGSDGALVAFELALALTLTTVAVLATRSLLNARAVDPGYDADRLVATRLSLTSGDASSDARRLAGAQLERLLGADSAIAAAGLVSFRPLYSGNPATGVLPYGSDMEPVVSDVMVATASYFAAAGIDVLQGRVFADDDVPGIAPPVVINQTLARQLGDGSVLGQRIIVRLSDPFREGSVVGVVDDVRLAGPLVDPRATVYFRHRDWPVNTLDVVARAATTNALAAAAVRRAVRELDPRLAVWDEAEMTTALRAATVRERSLAGVLFVFSIVALMLAAAGVYAAAAVRAAARRREFGVRIALGATPSRLSTGVLREAVVLAIPGVVAGALIVLAGSGLLRRVLFGIQPADTLTLTATAALLIAVVLLASAVPAWRASRTEPSEALRSE